MHVIVVGGGAAGMMAAIAAAQAGTETGAKVRVTLLEQNEKLGKKLFITGKGRCNVTNAGDMDNLFANVMTNAKFLYSAFYSFDNRAVMDLLETEGCPLKIERGERVFPVSDHSSDVIAALTRAIKRLQVEVYLHTRVKSLWWEEFPDEAAEGQESFAVPEKRAEKKKKGPIGKVRGVLLEGGKRMSAARVLLATG